MVITLGDRLVYLLKRRLPSVWGIEVLDEGASGKLLVMIEVNRYEARVISFDRDELQEMNRGGLKMFSMRAADCILADRAQYVKQRRKANGC